MIPFRCVTDAYSSASAWMWRPVSPLVIQSVAHAKWLATSTVGLPEIHDDCWI